MGLPRMYRKGARRLASYAYVDLVTGRSYGTVYAGDVDSGTEVLSFEKFDSSALYHTESSAGAGAYILDDTRDYDISVQRAFVLQGRVLITTTIGAMGNGANQMFMKVIYKLKKGSTLIGTSANYFVYATNGNEDANRETFSIDISSTKFAPGDIVRLTVEVWTKGDGSCIYAKSPFNKTLGLGNFPDADNYDSTFIMLLPFRVYD